MKSILLLLVLFACSAEAQTKIRFHSYNSVGIIEGERSTSSAIESVNGLSFNKWFAGAGIALDHYAFRTTPVYLQLRKEFKKPVFVYASAGENYPWVKTNPDNPAWMKIKFYPGFYYEGGIGYRWPVGKKNSILLSAGYSQKKLEEKRTLSGICFTWPCQAESFQKFDYRLRTLVLKAGIRF